MREKGEEMERDGIGSANAVGLLFPVATLLGCAFVFIMRVVLMFSFYRFFHLSFCLLFLNSSPLSHSPPSSSYSVPLLILCLPLPPSILLLLFLHARSPFSPILSSRGRKSKGNPCFDASAMQ